MIPTLEDSAARTYIVTGGASGIGLGVVQKLLSLSAVVHIIDIADTIPRITTPYQQEQLHFHPGTDVSSRDSVQKAFRSVLEISPAIHGLITCAGISSLSTSVIESDEEFERVMAVNLHGTWITGTEYLRYVLDTISDTAGVKEGTGNIVTIGSTASFQASRGIAAYCTSKHAIVGLTKSWAQDFAAKGVRINCVAPGVTDTPLLSAHQNALSGPVIDHFLHAVPMKRLATCSEISNMVVFLLGDSASFITGQVIAVNGGAV